MPRTSLSVLLDHFDHAIAVAGPDHVGLGADWDGVDSMPRELGDVSQLPSLTRGLLARGHAPATVRKVLGENLLRVMGEVEQRAESGSEGPLPLSPHAGLPAQRKPDRGDASWQVSAPDDASRDG